MRAILVLALALLACGTSDKSCSEVLHQDCGPTVSVTLRYMTFQFPDAGPVAGGTDAGFEQLDSGVCTTPCQCSFCQITKEMPLAQLRYAVQPKLPCPIIEHGDGTYFLDCVGTAKCGFTLPPTGAGVGTGECSWSPPLLLP